MTLTARRDDPRGGGRQRQADRAGDVGAGTVKARYHAHAGSGRGGRRDARDGQTAITAGIDGRIALWNLAGSGLIRPHPGPAAPFDVGDDFTPRGVAMSPAGRTLAITQSDGTVDLVDAATLRRRDVLRTGTPLALAVDFSPDGRLLAVTGDRGRVGLWDTRTLTPVARLSGLRSWTQAVAFSPDGRLVAAGDTNDARAGLRIWDVATHTPTSVRADLRVNALTFSPHGRTLAVAAMDKGVEVRDPRSGAARRAPAHRGVRALRGVLARRAPAVRRPAQRSGPVLLHARLASGRRPHPRAGPEAAQRPLHPRRADAGDVERRRHGEPPADVATRKPIGPPVPVRRDSYVAAVMSGDGAHVFALSAGTQGIRLALSPSTWKQQACAIAGRELTAREWADALPGRGYRRVCG